MTGTASAAPTRDDVDPSRSLTIAVRGIALWTPARPGWSAFVDALAGRPVDAAPVARPAATVLPAAERRRAPDGVSVALAVARDAIADARRRGIDVASLPSVFASAYGDLAIVDYLAATLADDPLALSPTRFHLSVHNAASGYWSIATGDRAPSTALAGGDDTFALGLLEVATLAATVDGPALLVVFDTPATGRLVDAVDSRALFGFAIVVAPAHGGAALARVSLALRDGRAPMPAPVDADVRALAATSPAAHALSFAEAIARGGIGLLEHPVGTATSLVVRVDAPPADATPIG